MLLNPRLPYETLGRLTSVVLTTVLLSSAALTIAGANSARQAASNAHQARIAAGQYQAARFEVAAEESLERIEELQPSRRARAALRASAFALASTMDGIARDGDARDGTVARAVISFLSLERRGARGGAATGDVRFEEINRLVVARGADRQAEAEAAVREARIVQGRTVGTMVAMSLVGVFFLGVLLYILAAYRRKLREVHETEIRALAEAATTDELTGLGNHRSYKEEVEREVARAIRYGEMLSLALVDVDDLGVVNDQSGHLVGDRLLKTLASTLDTGRAEDRAFRLGGDEFAILLAHTSAAEAQRLMEELRLHAEGTLLGTTISVGIATLDHQACRTGVMLQNQAAAALLAAKRGGRNGVTAFREHGGMWPISAARVQSLRLLVANEEINVAFQAIWDIEHCSILAYEALARPAASYGFAGPQEAFDVAERIGRAHELDAVCRKRIFARAGELPPGVLLFVNVTPQAFEHADFDAERFAALVVAAGLSPQRVVIEIVERSIAHLDVVIRSVLALQRQGFQLALDDTGAGNAGLEMLSQIPVDFVKIDRAVVEKALTDAGARGVLAGIIAIAQATGAYVIAEGIENAEMLRLVCSAGGAAATRGIHGVQGYLVQRPSEVFPDAAEVKATAAVLENLMPRDARIGYDPLITVFGAPVGARLPAWGAASPN